MAKRKGPQVTVTNCSADGAGYFIVGTDDGGTLYKFHSESAAAVGDTVSAPVETR